MRALNENEVLYLRRIMRSGYAPTDSELFYDFCMEAQGHRCILCNKKKPGVHFTKDHINGNHGDDRLDNVRLVCPDCAAKLPTHGGGNIGWRERLAKAALA